MPRNRRCATCGSKRFHKDGASGQIVCEDGHVVESFTQEAEGDRISHSQRTRRHRKEKAVKEKPVSTVYRGARSRYLLLQALQLLLRKQIAALRDVFGFPEELELIARDLWACYVSSIDLEPEPLLAKVREEPVDAESVSESASTRASMAPSIMESDAEIERRMELDVPSDEESEPSDTTAGTDATSMRSRSASMALTSKKKRRKRGASTATTEGGESEAGSAKSTKKGSRRHYASNEYDPRKAVHLWFTLVICYLSCLTLRLPLMVNDLINLALSRKLPYLDAVDLLPEAMWEHIQYDLRRQLDVSRMPKVVAAGEQGLYNWIRRFVLLYRDDYGISFPDMVLPPIVWRSVKHFALPPLVYVSARRLLQRADIDLSLGDSVGGVSDDDEEVAERKSGRGKFVVGNSHPPEVAIVAGVILCIRLLWTLDNKERAPFDLQDPLSALFRRDDFLAALTRLDEIDAEHSLTASWSLPIESLDDDQIDDYLDQLETALVKPSRPPADPDVLDRIFPRQPFEPRDRPDGTAAVNEALASLYAEMQPPSLKRHDDTAHLPLKQYSSSDTAGVLPEPMAKVLDRAAALVGVSREDMLKAVGKLERKLLKQQK